MSALWDYLTGKLAADGAALDEKRLAMNESQRASRGEEWYQQTLANNAKDAADMAAAQQSIADEFKPSALVDNLAASSSSAASGIRSFLAPILEFPFKVIPWQGWVIIGGTAFFYFGGAQALKKLLAKYLR